MESTATIANSPQLNWDGSEIAALIRAALDEDLRASSATPARDLTTESTVPKGATARAKIVAKHETTIAGLPLAERVFRALDATVLFTPLCKEGSRAAPGATVAQIEGQARAILIAERTAMNFLTHLSGIATLTRKFVELVRGTKVQIRDTRKTTPLLRAFEKYAVRMGGGANHRFGLYDAILMKENHVALAGGIENAVKMARKAAELPEMTAYESFRPAAPIAVQVEVRNAAELQSALGAGAESVLLDNMAPAIVAQMVQAARARNPQCVVEVSGGVTLANVAAYAKAGPDFISVGALTHSAPAADLSLLVEVPARL